MAVAFAPVILVAGCKGADDDYAPAVLPKVYPFEGAVDAKYVGTWAATDGSSTMSILKDGKLGIETVSHSMNGKSVGHVSGNWLASGNSLMFKYSVRTQPPTVLKYTATLTGNTLTLQLADAKKKTEYKKK
jgi:hypothetical protein